MDPNRIGDSFGPGLVGSATWEPLIKSHEGATRAFRDEMREARRSEWLTPFASRATKQIARKAASRPGFGAMRRLRRCAPRA